jgi:D-alanyl-lipoteichoic acid acyltransferase DltB (MBOAT superfamily)
MSVVQLPFFCFTAISLLLYYICPLKIRQVIPLAASAVFFIWGCGLILFGVMCAMSLFVWLGAIAAEDAKEHKRIIAAGVIVTLIVLLIAFKENAFFTTNANIIGRILRLNIDLKPPRWAAPLGMSYFTLTLAGYLADVYWGKTKAEKNPLKILLFTCYFPQMTLGPFSRFDEMNSDNLFVGHRFDYDNFCFGLQRMVWGLFKKLVLAERLAVVVSAVYDGAAAGTHAGPYIFIGAIAYVLQLYTDFSGAIDVIVGVSQMFGVRLPENFRQPFFSRSLSETWRRWHMTLGFWLKDYVMYPVQKALTTKFGKAAKAKLGKKAGKDVILYASMLVTWFCVGFWHGGSWKYICSSGLFFFVMIVGGLLLQPLFDRLKKLLYVNTEAWSWHLFESLRSFTLFAFSVSFGRAASLTDGFKMWGLAFADIRRNAVSFALACLDRSIYTAIGLDRKDCALLCFGLLVLLFVSVIQLKGGVRERLARQNIAFRWAVYLSMLFAVVIFGVYGPGYDPSAFIYAGF